MTKKKADVVLFENERQTKLLEFFKNLGYILALDIRDNRALQRSAYQLDDNPVQMDAIQQLLLSNIKICDYVFSVSQACKELYPKKYQKKIFVVENASDPDLFKFTRLPDVLRVGFISGISPGRGIEVLINAMKLVKRKIPEVILTIGGSPSIHHQQSIDYYNTLKHQYESNWILFCDDIFYSINASQFIQECYLTVIPHPSHIHYHTTLPVKLFDYLACGRPVVSTNCKETAFILQTYNCGLITDFTPEDMAEKIVQLLLNRDLASRMGENGRTLVEDIYNWDNMAKKMIAVLSR